ncbi:MAG TPA: ribonuclease P protein component [Burkholderiaceae bacterium]|nr:ribonuclease P protein component [Burkholderiaceae bacterium]
MIGRLLRSADFERVLGTPTQAKSAHFAVHHVAGRPSAPAKPVVQPESTELSTGQSTVGHRSVDDWPRATSATIDSGPSAGLARLWLGAVVPKRHARRSVTRSLLKRQIRAAVAGREASLAQGLWVVRLRSPFERSQFPSAASLELKHTVRAELIQLLGQAALRAPRA